jgi:small redox-active disulfide protein 2
MEISVLGPGCRNCTLLEKRVDEALERLGIQATVTKVTDYDEILALGVMATPGLVINGTVLLSGKVPTTSAIAEMIAAQQG